MKRIKTFKLYSGSLNTAVVFESSKSTELDRELLKAVKSNKIDHIKSLVKAGANINIQDRDGWTPLMYAVRYYASELTSLIIELGANVNIINNGGYSAVMLAANFNSPALVELLIKAGSNLDFKDVDGETALILSCAWNRVAGINMYDKAKVITLLIQAGADMNVKNNRGNNFIDVLLIGNSEGMRWLKTEEAQRLILTYEPTLIKTFKKHNILIHPNIASEFAHLLSGSDLNLL